GSQQIVEGGVGSAAGQEGGALHRATIGTGQNLSDRNAERANEVSDLLCPAPAETGERPLLIAGSEKIFDRHLPVLRLHGVLVHHVVIGMEVSEIEDVPTSP